MKRVARVSLILAASAVLLSGCNCFKKMQKNIDLVDVKSNPELLTLQGTTVTSDLTVTFPAKYVNKNAVIRITPYLDYDGGQIQGTPKYFQGEKVKDNYQVVPFKSGGRYTHTVVFPYDAAAKMSRMQVVIEAKCKNGDFYPIKDFTVAQGISTIQNEADWTAYMTYLPDNFKRITTITQDADINYLVNSAQVRPVALNNEQIALFEEFVRENKDAYRTTLGNIYAKGYASPEGPTRFNEELSEKRSTTGKDAISKRLNDVDVTFDAAAYGEDWEGFQKLVQGSNMQDKDLILQVLQMYSSPIQREEQIKNMSQVYDVLKKDILPELRRTQLVASADIEGKTDAEIRDFVRGDISNLDLEETLYGATLLDDLELKEKAYRTAAEKYNDDRAYNNYGVVLAKQGRYDEAKRAFDRAASLRSTTEVSNNLGALALANGETAEARRYLAALNSNDAKANMALVALAEGDYTTAVRGLDGYNLAVAEFCNGNLSQAKAALGNSTCPCADYLRAVIASREGDNTGAAAHLRTAIEKDPSMRAKAAGDVELVRAYGMI